MLAQPTPQPATNPEPAAHPAPQSPALPPGRESQGRASSLREQLMRAAMLTTLVVVLLSAVTLLLYELVSNRKAWVADLRTHADLVAGASTSALELNDPEAARESLFLLKAQPRIQSAALYDLDGRLFASYASTSTLLDARRPVDVPTFEPRFRGSILEVAYPIEREGQRLGTLYLSARHDIWPRLLGFTVTLLGLGAVSLTIAFYLFGNMQRRITAPLEDITKVAREVISTHNWALRAPATDSRDVGLLVDAVNRMLQECQTRTSELEQEVATRRNAEHELREADRQKDVFLATLAHELRNPLAPMTSAVALLQMSRTPPDMRDKAVNVLDRQIKSMVRLVNDLLDTSRATTGKLTLNLEPLDIGELISTAVEDAKCFAQRQGLALSVDLPKETICVDGDAVRLVQVLANLLNNACQYTPRGGRVEVVLTTEKSSVLIAVRDNGVGVAPDMQARIFDMFEQADKSLARVNAGLGLGLTLCRQIVELHNGEVTMTSDGAGRGSCFMVRLPRLECACDDEGDANGPDAMHLRPLHILIADDNVDTADNFAELLRSSGHTVDVVHDGEAALRQAQTTTPDIALLDIGMPKIDGHEVARRLRRSELTSNIHLVAISGWGFAADKEAAKLAGFDHHLIKPVDPEELVKLLVEAFAEFVASRPGDLV